MSTPSPLLPQGALAGVSAPKSRVRITVLTILALHVVFIGGLLLQGCNRDGGTLAAGGEETNSISALPPLDDTNYFSSFPSDIPTAQPSTTTTAGGSTIAATSSTPSVASSTSGGSFSPPETSAESTYSMPTGQTVASRTTTDRFPPPVTSYDTPGSGSGFGTGTGAATSFGRRLEHVIAKGDTIGALAVRYGVTERAILDANPGVKPRALKIGQTLEIPPPTPAPVSSRQTAAAAPLPAGAQEYFVQPGDNLTKIARKFGVTVAQLRAANGIRGDRIVPKQRLIIPAKTNGSTNM